METIKFKIMVVDSGRVARKVIVSEFADPDFQVVETSSLDESAKIAYSEKFDLITLGVHFQDGTGFDLCKKIRTERINEKPFASFNARILFVTSEYNDANRIKAHDVGANGFLEKNSDLISFKETLAVILKDLKLERQNTVKQIKFPKESDLKISLLVDDSELNLVLFRRLLEARGIKVQTAISGEHALRLLSENPHQYGVLLTDMYMPNMDGDELCKKIRGIPGLSELRLGIITASNEAELAMTKIP